MRKIGYGLIWTVCALIPTIESAAQTPDQPHPWCRSLSVVILANDPNSGLLAESFSGRLNSNFDLKGYYIDEAEKFESILTGIQENEIDFAILPFSANEPLADKYLEVESRLSTEDYRKYMADQRLFVLGGCCNKETIETETAGVAQSKLDVLRDKELDQMNYRIIASPKIFEMGYQQRDLIYISADEGVSHFIGELVAE